MIILESEVQSRAESQNPPPRVRVLRSLLHTLLHHLEICSTATRVEIVQLWVLLEPSFSGFSLSCLFSCLFGLNLAMISL